MYCMPMCMRSYIIHVHITLCDYVCVCCIIDSLGVNYVECSGNGSLLISLNGAQLKGSKTTSHSFLLYRLSLKRFPSG